MQNKTQRRQTQCERHIEEQEKERKKKKQWKTTHQKESFGEFYFISRFIVPHQNRLCVNVIVWVGFSLLPAKLRKIKTKWIANCDWYTQKVGISQENFAKVNRKKVKNIAWKWFQGVFFNIFFLFFRFRVSLEIVEKMNRCMSIEVYCNADMYC